MSNEVNLKIFNYRITKILHRYKKPATWGIFSFSENNVIYNFDKLPDCVKKYNELIK